MDTVERNRNPFIVHLKDRSPSKMNAHECCILLRDRFYWLDVLILAGEAAFRAAQEKVLKHQFPRHDWNPHTGPQHMNVARNNAEVAGIAPTLKGEPLVRPFVVRFRLMKLPHFTALGVPRQVVNRSDDVSPKLAMLPTFFSIQQGML